MGHFSVEWLPVVLYALTGAAQPPLVDQLRYAGATSAANPHIPPTLITMLCNVFGMAMSLPLFQLVSTLQTKSVDAPVELSVIKEPLLTDVKSTTENLRTRTVQLAVQPGASESLDAEARDDRTCSRIRQNALSMCLAVMLDFASGGLLMLGMLRTGGSVFVVLYNSCTIFTPLLSLIWGTRSLTRQQWVGVLAVFLGLALNGYHAHSLSRTDALEQINHTGNEFLLGIVLTLFGALLHSSGFVLAESILTHNGVQPTVYCSVLGVIETFVLVVYNVGLATWFGPSELYLRNIENKHVASAQHVLLLLMSLVTVNAVHALTFFLMLASKGAVYAGMLKGVQLVIVVLFNGVAFCGIETTQCLDPTKTASVAIVLAGILLHSRQKSLTAKWTVSCWQ